MDNEQLQWIDVETEMPEDNGYYLVTYEYEGVYIVGEGYLSYYLYSEDGLYHPHWYVHNDGIDGEVKVVAWMPTPAPYVPPIFGDAPEGESK